MTTTFTVNLDAELLELAEQEARTHHTTLPEVVAHQLRVMARNQQDTREGRTPITDSLRGVVSLPPEFDERTELAKELQQRYGLQG
jgi:hypothetical protein